MEEKKKDLLLPEVLDKLVIMSNSGKIPVEVSDYYISVFRNLACKKNIDEKTCKLTDLLYAKYNEIENIVYNRKFKDCMSRGTEINIEDVRSDAMVQYVRDMTLIIGGEYYTPTMVMDNDIIVDLCKKFKIEYPNKAIDQEIDEYMVRSGIIEASEYKRSRRAELPIEETYRGIITSKDTTLRTKTKDPDAVLASTAKLRLEFARTYKALQLPIINNYSKLIAEMECEMENIGKETTIQELLMNRYNKHRDRLARLEMQGRGYRDAVDSARARALSEYVLDVEYSYRGETYTITDVLGNCDIIHTLIEDVRTALPGVKLDDYVEEYAANSYCNKLANYESIME